MWGLCLLMCLGCSSHLIHISSIHPHLIIHTISSITHPSSQINRYKIHIDNLCTFLPQDKVGNFSGFDKQALLVETEKSLSGHLYSTHQDLIKLESELQSSGTDVATIQTELSKLTKENERLEREKELMEQREQYIERIDLLKKKRAWLVFDSKREEAKNAKEKREELKKQKKEAEKAIRPLQEKHAEVESEVGQIKSRYKATEDRVRFLCCVLLICVYIVVVSWSCGD